MGGGASRDRQELASRTSFGPQQIVSVPSLQTPSGGGGPGAANLLLQQPPGFGAPQGDLPGPGAAEVPRLTVQQTCVVKNPVNLHKHSLKCFQDSAYPDRLFFSFLFDSSTEVDVSVPYYARQLTDPVTGAPSFVSRLAYPPPGYARRLPAGMGQFFCTTPDEALMLADWQAGHEEEADGSNGVCPVTVCLSSVPPASAASPSPQATMVKNQYTFARIVHAPRGGTSTRTSAAEGSDSSAASDDPDPGAAGDPNSSFDGANEWRAQIVKQKIQFGTRTFEVQEIFGIERGNSTEMQRLPMGGRTGRAAGDADGDAKGSAQSAESAGDNFSGRECVICLTEERNTAVLPCRHMCLCSGCANIMRMQSNKCPICRQPVTSLLQITMRPNSE
ncbi:RING zinc finger protein [Besnoitia besnoiti]|uniref:RING zinc finger protein n=1 Tax=Besnoitia besnoiti TaxID=94643 RepID=A0A2A9MI26_BESBE|nr:RING zinc finger protein [Besnoitia besnoiti]PFH36854.1 RING zinc finger protein [Besnoitia besnoiti]